MVPESGACTPVSILMSVDFPRPVLPHQRVDLSGTQAQP